LPYRLRQAAPAKAAATPDPKAPVKAAPEAAPKAGPKPAAPAKPAAPEAAPKTGAKPATTTPAAPAKGQEAAAGRTAAAGAKTTTTTTQAGQGARPGIGKFEFIEPDRPSVGRRWVFRDTVGTTVHSQCATCVHALQLQYSVTVIAAPEMVQGCAMQQLRLACNDLHSILLTSPRMQELSS
jgi:hypothetical protein